MSVPPVPTEHPCVSPYLLVQDVRQVVEFLQRVFDGVPGQLLTDDDGNVNHAEVRVGDSLIMIGRGSGDIGTGKSMIHVYVEDSDATYARALEAGATPVMPISDQFYGDRSGGVEGPQGNYWWIASRIETVPPDEIARRAKEAYRSR